MNKIFIKATNIKFISQIEISLLLFFFFFPLPPLSLIIYIYNDNAGGVDGIGGSQ